MKSDQWLGSMKKKRRKKEAADWAGFQVLHKLSDGCLELARATGYSFKLLGEKLKCPSFDESLSVADRINAIHCNWQDNLAARQVKIESGELKAKPKPDKKKINHDPQWAHAKQVCRLNMEDIRMAKELGLSPKSLMKNVPDSSQQWKAPVRDWIRDLYEQRQQRARSDFCVEPADVGSIEF